MTEELKGQRILITRPVNQAQRFESLVKKHGGIPVLFPVIEIKPLNFEESLREALSENFSWVIFTSVNGVRFAFESVKNIGAKFCAIGPATAREIEKRNGRVDFIPDEFTARKIASSLPVRRGEKVLLLRAKIAPPDLRLSLERRGIFVTEIPVYDTVAKTYSKKDVIKKLSPVPDFSTFTSSSTFLAFLHILRSADIDPTEYFEKSKIAAIGPVTAKTAMDEGFKPHIVAENHTIEGLVDAMIEYLKTEGI